MEQLVNVKVIMRNATESEADQALFALAFKKLIVDATCHKSKSAIWKGGQLCISECFVIEGISTKELIIELKNTAAKLGGKLSSACMFSSESKRMLRLAQLLRQRYDKR